MQHQTVSDLKTILEREPVKTVMQAGVSQPIWVVFSEDPADKVVRLFELDQVVLPLPPWTKLEFLWVEVFKGKEYALFQIRRIDKEVDLSKMDTSVRGMPAIQTAVDFGQRHIGSLIALDFTQIVGGTDVL